MSIHGSLIASGTNRRGGNVADEIKVISNEHMEISMLDNASPLLTELLAQYPNSKKIALQSTGKYTKLKIQAGIKAKAPGGRAYASWAKLHTNKNAPLKLRKDRAKNPLGKLQKLIRYQMLSNNDGVKMGWFDNGNSKTARLETIAEEGKQYPAPMTAKMRKFLWASGVPVSKNKTAIGTPARPTVEPTFNAEKNNLVEHFSNKFFEYLMKGKG